MHLEADEIALCRTSAIVAAEVVFAIREKDG
jgi:hypothetical protein